MASEPVNFRQNRVKNIFKGINKEEFLRQQTICIESITVSDSRPRYRFPRKIALPSTYVFNFHRSIGHPERMSMPEKKLTSREMHKRILRSCFLRSYVGNARHFRSSLPIKKLYAINFRRSIHQNDEMCANSVDRLSVSYNISLYFA